MGAVAEPAPGSLQMAPDSASLAPTLPGYVTRCLESSREAQHMDGLVHVQGALCTPTGAHVYLHAQA